MKDEKLCLECGEPIKGRLDKKFCDDQCRSNYNNKANSDATAEVRNINNALRKNRRILESVVNKDGKGRISRAKLLEEGFNFKYITQLHNTKANTTYKLCYDYGYMPVENDFFVVIKWGVFLNKEN